ncbi:MAG: DoxX family membrane protein [Chloroflexi bacterium]|nr:DoxX family membrane protein [Chloroflexota bacterium]
MARALNLNTGYSLPSNPPLLGRVFHSPALAVVWLVIRLYLGWQWLQAGWEKFTNPTWVTTGTALKGFWSSAVAVPANGHAAITYDWYRVFLTAMLQSGSYTWFAKLIVFGELAVGIALIVGAFVGVAAAFGAVMNFSYMLAGSAGVNPVYFVLAVVLVLAWKMAGYWGLDYWLLKVVRTPWEWLAPVSDAPERISPAAG